MKLTRQNGYWAILGKTTREGAYLVSVADAAKNIGLANQSSYPDSGGTWAEQYAPIPKALFDRLIAECNAFLKDWQIRYEWVPMGFGKEHVIKALKHAPLQMVFPNHAVCAVALDGDYVVYLDSYAPFLKRRHLREFTSALKIVLTPKLMNQTKVVKGKDGKTLFLATPIPLTFEQFQKLAHVQGIVIPEPIPPASDL